jgi:hypothetical protein
MPLDRTGNDRAEEGRAAGENPAREEPEVVKERETKEDGRYIIFYSFGDEETREDG